MISILAAGNHATDIAAIATRCGFQSVLYDDDPATGRLAPDDVIDNIIIGVNDPKLRREMALRFNHLRGAQPLVDPSVVKGPNVYLGRGVVLAPLVSVLTSVTLKDHVHVNYHASMTRCLVGAYTTVAPAATICGNVTIGEACLIGAGSVVCERVNIGNEVTIAAGALVPPHSFVPDNETVMGVWKGK